jgi:hypothetical protein
MSEEYSVGYSEGYQAGWNAAMDAIPPAAPVLEGRDWSLLEATQESLREHMAEIKRLKEAQPAPVQEPVGEVNRYGLDSHGRKWHGIYWYDPNVDVAHGTKLYTTPPAARRPWVGLTDDELRELCGEASSFGTSSWVRHVEAKLRSKNT